MFEIVKSVLAKGGYDLTAITKKIKALWVQGDLSETEYAELIAMAQGGAEVKYSLDLLAKVEELDKRIIALENKGTSTDTTEETVADFVDGKWYYNGDKCGWNGKTYICIAPEGVVCVWSPEAYPAYWDEVK